MSIRCAFTSRRPSSNTANSPAGPAPIMTTSVVIVSSAIAAPHLVALRISGQSGKRVRDSKLRTERKEQTGYVVYNILQGCGLYMSKRGCRQAKSSAPDAYFAGIRRLPSTRFLYGQFLERFRKY